MVTRRQFFKMIGGAGLAVIAAKFKVGESIAQVVAQIPGGSLDPLTVDKFVTPLLIPPVMPKAGTIPVPGMVVDYYEISMRQFQEQILPANQPPTTVWGYGAVKSASSKGILLHHAPSLTIEANYGFPVRVKWINELVDANGNYLPHLLPVDPTLHWANPGGGVMGRDTRPTFTDGTPGPYTGPVPMVTHVHGAVGVGDESDGYAEAWWLPAANNIPPEFATVGTWYDFFKGKSTRKGINWTPGSATFQYPNRHRAATIWYHDHTVGMTRTNVYAGPAGFFIVRGGPDGDMSVRDSRTKLPAILPGPAPRDGDGFPTTKKYYEIPIAIQDRSFNADGSLFYPDSREFFDNYAGPFIPDSDVSPIWNPEFFGNYIMVNGNTWPYLNVEQRRYRFRVLDGCDARTLILDFSAIPGVQVWMIGNEGGFLAAPVNLTASNANHLLMGPAERADLIVDFSKVAVGSYTLKNIGPDVPYNGDNPPEDTADPATTGQIMQFRVVPRTGLDLSTPPQYLVLPAIAPLPAEVRTRRLALLEMTRMMPSPLDIPVEAMLGRLDENGYPHHQMWMEPVSENPSPGDTEIWEFYNFTMDAHPMHIHEITFELVNRESITIEGEMDSLRVTGLVGDVTPPKPWENGRKDTVLCYPGQVTRVKAQFTNPGQFVWHCHIVEHEDNEMMRPFRVGPLQKGQPPDGM